MVREGDHIMIVLISLLGYRLYFTLGFIALTGSSLARFWALLYGDFFLNGFLLARGHVLLLVLILDDWLLSYLRFRFVLSDTRYS